MGLYYFDASALVKYYVIEPGSTWVRDIVDRRDPDTGERANTVFISEASVAEAAAAFAVLHRTRRIRQRTHDGIFSRFMTEADTLFKLIPIISGDFHSAAHLTQRHPLRAYDAVQLTVALRHQEALVRRHLSLTFVSSDGTQLKAAEAEGLLTENPFEHVAPTDMPSLSSRGSQ